MGVEDLLSHPLLWRGQDADLAGAPALPTGFEALDRYLPGGGWPLSGISEIFIERYGLDVVHAYMAHIQAAAERKMRAALAKINDGEYHFEDRLDDGSPIRVAISIEGDSATIDFAGTGPVLVGNLNANRAIVSSAGLYCLRCLIDEDIPLNAGVMAPIEIILPECRSSTGALAAVHVPVAEIVEASDSSSLLVGVTLEVVPTPGAMDEPGKQIR